MISKLPYCSAELLIVASLLTVFFSCHSLTTHCGRWSPSWTFGFGLGIFTTQVCNCRMLITQACDTLLMGLSYFWSFELWGGVTSNSQRHGKNPLLVELLLASGMISLMAGPATAVRMIPRTRDWPTGGSLFWLNG